MFIIAWGLSWVQCPTNTFPMSAVVSFFREGLSFHWTFRKESSPRKHTAVLVCPHNIEQAAACASMLRTQLSHDGLCLCSLAGRHYWASTAVVVRLCAQLSKQTMLAGLDHNGAHALSHLAGQWLVYCTGCTYILHASAPQLHSDEVHTKPIHVWSGADIATFIWSFFLHGHY